MPLTAIYAQLSCTDLERSTEWFASVFQREPDATPMKGLAEWHHHREAGFQLFEDEDNAGRGTLTLIVSDIRAEHARLSEEGLEPGQVEPADYTTLARIRDPDGILVVLAQPGKG